MATIKKLILLTSIALLVIGCNMAMDGLDVDNGTKYIVTSKTKKSNKPYYTYRLIKIGDYTWYDYTYKDTSNFEVGDTLVLTIKKVNHNL
jgi:hypothetical protein